MHFSHNFFTISISINISSGFIFFSSLFSLRQFGNQKSTIHSIIRFHKQVIFYLQWSNLNLIFNTHFATNADSKKKNLAKKHTHKSHSKFHSENICNQTITLLISWVIYDFERVRQTNKYRWLLIIYVHCIHFTMRQGKEKIQRCDLLLSILGKSVSSSVYANQMHVKTILDLLNLVEVKKEKKNKSAMHIYFSFHLPFKINYITSHCTVGVFFRICRHFFFCLLKLKRFHFVCFHFSHRAVCFFYRQVKECTLWFATWIRHTFIVEMIYLSI